MSREPQQIDESSLHNVFADFGVADEWNDEAGYLKRRSDERKRARSKAQRQAQRNRPKVRDTTIGLRTTKDFKALLARLSAERDMSMTEIIEAAVALYSGEDRDD